MSHAFINRRSGTCQGYPRALLNRYPLLILVTLLLHFFSHRFNIHPPFADQSLPVKYLRPPATNTAHTGIISCTYKTLQPAAHHHLLQASRKSHHEFLGDMCS